LTQFLANSKTQNDDDNDDDDKEQEERENLETLLTTAVYHILLVEMKVIQISLSNR